MTIHDDDLGGRLRLRNPAEMPAAQKRIYDRLNAGMIKWAEEVPFRSTTSGGRLIGPYNPMLLSPNTTSGFLDFIESAASSNNAGRQAARSGDPDHRCGVEVGL